MYREHLASSFSPWKLEAVDSRFPGALGVCRAGAYMRACMRGNSAEEEHTHMILQYWPASEDWDWVGYISLRILPVSQLARWQSNSSSSSTAWRNLGPLIKTLAQAAPIYIYIHIHIYMYILIYGYELQSSGKDR